MTAEVKKHTWIYFTVFGGLALLTLLTVAVASLELAVGMAVGVALTIAAFKGSLVASFFMHLLSERRLVLVILLFTLLFFVVLLLVPIGDAVSNVGERYVP